MFSKKDINYIYVAIFCQDYILMFLIIFITKINNIKYFHKKNTKSREDKFEENHFINTLEKCILHCLMRVLQTRHASKFSF